jgi:fluoride exporter
MQTAIYIALAGALGSLSRWGVGVWTADLFGKRFAYGTLAVNLLGCFLMGLLATLFLDGEFLPKPLRIALTTGFLGAFTTFSTFGYETVEFASRGEWKLAAINISANVILGIVLAGLGVYCAYAVRPVG